METVQMSHGDGGKYSADLIQNVFMRYFGNEISAGMNDAAVVELPGKLAFTSDSFVVTPLFFPGGDIGRLAVCGTVNDLLTSGAAPRYLSACFILEEGLALDDLEKVCQSMADTAAEAGVKIITGDTKVIGSMGGETKNLFINTAGIGALSAPEISFSSVEPGDALIVTGTLGDHHACIMSRRMNIQNTVQSDAAPLTAIVSALREGGVPLHGMRDVTRGGLATICRELSDAAHVAVDLSEVSLPVSPEVAGFCKILGLDPLYMGNEGKMLIVVPAAEAEAVVEIIQSQPYGKNAAVIGKLLPGTDVTMNTRLGGRRLVPPLVNEGLPRIC